MCGIAGCFYFDRDETVNLTMMEAMRDSLSRRGPDDAGLFSWGRIALAFRRLSIIDLSNAGHQPMLSENKKIGLVFNGEIYNFKEIRGLLEKRGVVFKSKTDSEVVLRAYETWGTDCLQHLDGMFAFAIWDENKHELFIARDRFGIKPLIWAQDQKGFYFASEISSLLEIPHLTHEINDAAIWAYLGYLQIPAPLTIYKSIHKLMPAYAMTISASGKTRSWKYWQAPQVNSDLKKASQEDLQHQILDLLRASIKRHLHADVPVGLALSGGLDSSALVALAAQVSSHPLKTFSVTFADEPSANEEVYQRIISKHFSTQHYEIASHPDLLSNARTIIREAGEPYAISSATALLEICKLAKDHVKVLISGDGGDEIFGGYTSRYKNIELIRRLHRIFGPLAGPLAKAINIALPELSSPRRMTNKLKTFAHFLPLNDSERIFESHTVYTHPQKQKALHKNFHSHFKTNLSPAHMQSYNLSSASSPIDALLNADIMTTLSDEMLTKTDYATSAMSLEGRVPLLDKSLAELALQIPPDLKIKDRTGKYIFKESVQSFLPANIYNRPKQGFALPMSQYMKNRGPEWIEESKKLPWLNSSSLSTMLSQHQAGRRDWSMHLWAVECLRIWYEEVQ